MGVIDVEKGSEVKAMTPALLEKHGLPMFTCGAIGFGALLVAHEPGGMMPQEFWRLVQEQSDGGGLLPPFLGGFFNRPVMERMEQGYASGVLSTTAIGGLASNALLACEVLACLLQGTGLVDREPVFAPRFIAVDFLNQALVKGDVRR